MKKNNSSTSNDQIMEYYHKYGQDRDLEKYLRLRRNSTRSSSDGSIQAYNNESKQMSKIKGKSLENLTILKSSSEIKQKTPEPKEDDIQKEPEHSNKVIIATAKEKKSGKKYNFNVESVIEINMPQNLEPRPSEVSPSRGVNPELKSLSTQTVDEDPIQPILKVPYIKANEKTPDNTREISPESSITSNRQKLEWDSLGDIGYDSSEKYLFCGANELSEDERHKLKKYFARKGISFDKNVVVVKNLQTPRKPQENESTKSNSNTERWKDIFIKYKDKYIDQSINQVIPDAQSTPKPTEKLENKVEDNKSTQTSLKKNVSKSIQSTLKTDEKENYNAVESNKSTQTSLKNNTSKGIQAIHESTNKNTETDEYCDKTIPETPAGSNFEVVESFEYYSSSLPPASKSNSENTNQEEKLSVWTTESACSNNSQNASKFEKEVRLAFALFQAITESTTMEPEVKKVLSDKIFRKVIKQDEKQRSMEQLVHDYQHLLLKNAMENQKDEENKRIDVLPSILHSKGIKGKPDSSDSRVSSSLKSSNNSRQKSVNQLSISDYLEKQSNLEEKVVKKAIPVKEKRSKKALCDILLPMTHSEIDYQNHQKARTKPKGIPIKDLLKKDGVSPISVRQIDQEIEHLRYMKERIMKANHGRHKTNMKENKENMYENLEKNKTSLSDYDCVTNLEKNEKNKISSNNSSSWDSHCNMKKFINNNRWSKLETPASSQESVLTFIHNRKEKFIQNYEKQKRNRLYSSDNIYAKPCSQNDQAQYTELTERIVHKKKIKSKTPSSDIFMSSASISIPVANTNNNSNTTTTHYHQYDDIIETQTSNDGHTVFQKAQPIYATHPIHESKNVQVKNKLQQTSPKSIAYIIEFNGSTNSTSKDNTFSTNSTVNSNLASNSSVEKGTREMLSVKEHFVANRPQTLTKCEERRKIVHELNKLRKKRNQQRQKLLLLTSDDTLKRGDYTTPINEPVQNKRIFTSNGIRQQTKRHLCELPAVKKEAERKKTMSELNNFKKKCLIMKKVYEKNLRSRALKGQVNLSNSIRVV